MRWALYTLLGVGLLSIDPFGLGSIAEEGSQKVLYELAAPLYADTARDDIVLVLVTEQSLKALYDRRISGTNEWPLLYQDWAVILKTIIAHSPRAVFFDVLFEQERVTDKSLSALYSLINRLPSDFPLYFAGGIPPYNSPLLQSLNAKAALAGSAWEGFGHGVPLVQAGKPMAAYSLYRDACSERVGPLAGCNGSSAWADQPFDGVAPMSVMWGSKGALPLTAKLEGLTAESYCENGSTKLSDLLIGFFRSALGDVWQQSWNRDGETCLYHQTIDVDELMLVFDHGSAVEKQVLQQALKDKIVLVGTFFEGLPDQVLTPTMGQVPGVALHAMMLDNLMIYGDRYLRIAGSDSLAYNSFIWSLIVLVLVIWMAHREHNVDSDKNEAIASQYRLFTGASATWFLFVSFCLTGVAALVIVFGFRLEPANAISFLGLAELTRRIHARRELEQLKGWRKPYAAFKNTLSKTWKKENSDG